MKVLPLIIQFEIVPLPTAAAKSDRIALSPLDTISQSSIKNEEQAADPNPVFLRYRVGNSTPGDSGEGPL